MLFDDLAQKILAASTDTVSQVCGETRDLAKALCPVDSGELSASITASAQGLEGSVSARSPHACYVEFGTWKQQAQPFVQPAFNQVKAKAATMLASKIKGA